MAGSIRPRPDKGADAFELRVFLGRDAAGRVRHKSTLFRGSRRAAERELARLVTAQDVEPSVVPDDSSRRWGPATSVNDAIASWRHNGWQDLSPSTTRRYASIWSTHIEGSIGRRKIASLGPYDVELYLRGLKAKGLSEASVRQTRAMLHRACRLARKWSGNMLANPVADTELPDWAIHEQRDELRAPAVAEVRALLTAARTIDHRSYTYLLLVAATGMRRGEACAIRWSNLDLKSGAVTIEEGIVAADGGATVKAPKTKAGIRRVALDEGTLEALRTHRTDIGKLGSLGGFEVIPEHFVFATELPGALPPHPDTMSHIFSRARELAGVAKDVHLHSLRWAAAS